jgi:PAS domain S-box-containing protein
MKSDLKRARSDLKDSQSDLETSQRYLKVSEEESYHRLLELEVLYRTAPVALGFLDRELRYVRLNEALAKMNNLAVEAHIGRYAIDINPELSRIVVPMMAEVLASKQPLLNVEVTVTLPSDSKRERTWLANFHPVTNHRTFGVSVVFHDITVLKETEDVCTRFGLIVGSSEDAIISMGLDGTITSWNRAAEGVFGYSAEEVLGKTISILATPRSPNEITDILARLQQAGGQQRGERVETVQRRKDGRQVEVALTLSPIHDRHGALSGASEIARDITNRKRSDIALLRSNEELRQFAFAAAHDLQEPLRNIGLYSQLLDMHYKSHHDTEAEEHLKVVIESARRMQTLIKDLLMYTEVVDVHGDTAQAIDCNEACRSALDNLASALDDCKAAVTVAALPPVVAERTHIIQLFQNLISNALKYRAMERHPEIHVAAERRDDDWVFSIKDNGIGIAPEYHDRIFGVFKRLHGRDVPGTGIGLAICKRIIDHQGGRLWLESEVGGGSTFYFSFPGSN